MIPNHVAGVAGGFPVKSVSLELWSVSDSADRAGLPFLHLVNEQAVRAPFLQAPALRASHKKR